MRSIILAAALLASSSLASADPGKPAITAQTARSGGPIHPQAARLTLDTVDLAMEIFPDRESIAGVATLNFVAKDRVTLLPIDLDRNLPVSAISINGRQLPPTAWSNPDGRLIVKPPAPIAAGTKFAVRIAYAGQPHVAVRAPWDDGIVWSKTQQGAPWIATTAQFSGCDLYWPCIDYPTFEPNRIDLHLTVPKGLKAISNGVLTGTETLSDDRTTWNWSAKDPTLYGVAINVAPYEVVSGTYKSRFGNSIPMAYWYLPGEEAQAKELFAEFAPTLDFFESMIGPYPFGDQKLGVVETPHKGMEHQTVNAYGNAYAKNANGFDDLFHHEFSHEWFANQLTAANWDDFWLHEGTGTYMQPLYGQWREGDARYNTMMLQSRLGIQNRAPIVSGKPQDANAVYKIETGPGGDIYNKGSWVLHTLRGLIGDTAFFDALRLSIYGRTDPKPGNFKPLYRTTPEFIGFVNQTTGGDYRWFFDVYLYQAALPELIQTRSGNTLTLAWKTPLDKPFPLPVEVAIDGKVSRLAMTGGKDTLTLPEGAHVVVDPQAKILKREKSVDDLQAYRAAQAKR